MNGKLTAFQHLEEVNQGIEDLNQGYLGSQKILQSIDECLAKYIDSQNGLLSQANEEVYKYIGQLKERFQEPSIKQTQTNKDMYQQVMSLRKDNGQLQQQIIELSNQLERIQNELGNYKS